MKLCNSTLSEVEQDPYVPPSVVTNLPPAYNAILKNTNWTAHEKISLVANLRSLARAVVRIYLEEHGAPVSDEYDP